MLGEWINNLDYYKESYKNAKPFEYVIINNFFDDTYANSIYENFPLPSDNNNWHRYCNPFENKYSLNNFENHPKIGELFELLSEDSFISNMRHITSITDLEKDPHLHGAGVHIYPNNGKLDMHLDYNIHPITKKERRLNLIIYMNKDWKEEYGGKIELYNTNMIKITEEMPSFNTAIIFKTCDISYHGLPKPIKCPDDIFRKSIAIYYVSNPRDNITERYKAEYFPQLNQPVNDNIRKLYEIRKNRLITDDDLDQIYPNWKTDGNGYW